MEGSQVPGGYCPPGGRPKTPMSPHRRGLAKVNRSLVSIVDDDESVRESLPDLVKQLGFAARAFPSAEAFLASEFLPETRCLILDIVMPGMSGPGLQRELVRRGGYIPIVCIPANAGLGTGSRLLAGGGVECLAKPFSDAALLDALTAALRRE